MSVKSKACYFACDFISALPAESAIIAAITRTSEPSRKWMPGKLNGAMGEVK